MFLELKGLSKLYEAGKGLQYLDLAIEEGSFVTLLGPSGCGKTTTLNLLGGFLKPDSGSILLEEDEINQGSDIPVLDLPKLGIAPEHYEAVEKAVKDLNRQGLEIKIVKE